MSGIKESFNCGLNETNLYFTTSRLGGTGNFHYLQKSAYYCGKAIGQASTFTLKVIQVSSKVLQELAYKIEWMIADLIFSIEEMACQFIIVIKDMTFVIARALADTPFKAKELMIDVVYALDRLALKTIQVKRQFTL